MPETTLTNYSIQWIFIEIAAGRGTHSKFVRSFAQAIVDADHSNLAILRTAALRIIDKYHLEGYLKPLGKPQEREA